MYTVSKGPSKIVAKARRGLSQNYPKFESMKLRNKRSTEDESLEKLNLPRPIFQPFKKTTVPTKTSEDAAISPQHEEIIKYINDSWNIVVAVNPYDSYKTPSDDCNNNHSIVAPSNVGNLSSESNYVYCVEPPSPILNDFKPFDLESWWGRRLFNNITKSL